MKAAFVRHLFAIAALPFVVTVVVPVWIAQRNGIALRLGASAAENAAQLVGVVVLSMGVWLFAASLRRFATEGEGTLAPWDPPRRLVVRGPYRYVRNPMISGVVFILFAEALLLLSMDHFAWALAFLGANAIYIPLLEEPMLKERFGESYVEYRRNVPRLLPRLRPWEPAP
jgi:protein-S-isoprenylcysteine O-methyltransferase Ste14